MSAHKSIDKICVVITALTLLLTVVFCCGQSLGIETRASAAGYENRLFDRSKVHSFDIVIDDWDGFISTCENEEYALCNVVIDGEAVKNVGIRDKGNTSLSSVRSMGSSRYSFKIEFDQYDKGKSYHGLDKLCLNNLIQDNTFMKDYLAYSLMYDFGADAPLCSYAYVTVNGEDWGLYLAVEAVEDSFLTRCYGSNPGDLYKPDAMSFGGGRGNGRDFNMDDFMNQNSEDADSSGSTEQTEQKQSRRGGFGGGKMPGGFDPSQFGNGDFDPSQFGGGNFDPSQFGNGGFDPSQFGGGDFDPNNIPSDFNPSQMFGGEGGKGGFGGFGMGSDDVKLKYSDDEVSSYSNIFNNAKTTVTQADQKRLIAALKSLSEQTDLENTLDTDEVLRYFVVHLFLQNGDSYTGQMIHNYYLYEEDGQLSMIPWDYNLAYGSFMGGNASSSVNAAIDTPVSGDMSDRPMVSWIFDSAEYTEQYHKLFAEFLDSVDFEKMISETAAMIDSYVQKDPTKFCTYDEFQKGVEAITKFCTLREESVRGQLSGTIPSTSSGQSADRSALIDTGDLNTSDMGSMGGGGFGRSRDKTDSDSTEQSDAGTRDNKGRGSRGNKNSQTDTSGLKTLSNLSTVQKPAAGRPEGFDPSQFGGNMPDGFDPSQFGGNPPDGFDPSQFGGNPPDGFDPSQFGGRTQESGTKPDKQNGTTGTDSSGMQTTAGTQSGQERQTTANQQSSRPQPGGGSFPGMGGGASQNDRTAAYILLGVSALVLLLGICFAAKFRR